jgi:hypothetical protein
MPATCRFCLTGDLPDSALKCRACGSWLDPARDTQTVDTVRLTVREELRSDLKDHRAYLEGLLSQLKYVAALVVAAGLAATVYFGIRTDNSIADTAATIATTAEKQIEAATTDVTAAARERVASAVREKMESRETAALIEAVIAESVKAETGRRMAAVSADIDARVAAATVGLDVIGTEIAALKARSAKALAELAPVEESYSRARAQTVAGSQSVLPVDPVRVEEKGSLSSLDRLLQEPVGALGFTQGHYYDGPVVWAYVDRLRQQPGFRDIVVSTPDDRFFGMFDAAALAAALDPPGAVAMRRELDRGLAGAQLPSPDMVAGWSAFANAVNGGDLGFVAGLPGFVAADAAVGDGWTSLRALDQMERLGRDRLPVVDAGGRFVGVIERSRLTTRVLLEVAGGG